ncbi:MAG: hypothetical protein EA402_10045 [Planctomycetota bacterium]|nr:MAG: hypothetical protein EA402_10045 [Planctomycetota bacterium]
MKSLCGGVALAALLCLAWPTLAASEESGLPTVAELLAGHGQVQAASGAFSDIVTPLHGDAEGAPGDITGNRLEVRFWLQRPHYYHFIVSEGDDEDRQHYLANGRQRWQVEVVLGDAIVDIQPYRHDDPFARIQRLLQLSEAELAQDFTWEGVLALGEGAPAALPHIKLPAAWRLGLLLIPESPEMRSEVRRILLAFGDDRRLLGMVIDDTHDNRRLVRLKNLEFHESLDPALFVWQD